MDKTSVTPCDQFHCPLHLVCNYTINLGKVSSRVYKCRRCWDLMFLAATKPFNFRMHVITRIPQSDAVVCPIEPGTERRNTTHTFAPCPACEEKLGAIADAIMGNGE
jgi:hypothetical protein